MKFQQVKSMQKLCGYAELQKMIDTGMAWHMEGSYGRIAMDSLRSGACMLPTTSRRDAYGNTIPSRYQVAQGTTGSYRNTVNFYLNIDDYED
jgi:hypothetical protein